MRRSTGTTIELSLIIPVYNGAGTIAAVVDQIHVDIRGTRIEVILVNDGSTDSSQDVCEQLVEQYPESVVLVQLARNFGEHHAVLAGLKHACGRYAAILDDDGQNPPHEVPRMLAHAREHDLDVVYTRYRDRKHSWLRRLCSWFNDKTANMLLNKPRQLYLSSFKLIGRTVIDQVTRYRGPFPYIDALILRATRHIGQIEVEHRHCLGGRSRYTAKKLLALWVNVAMGFSMAPQRLSALLGVATSALGLMLLAYASWGAAMVLLAAGAQLISLGLLGEYAGRMFLQQSGMSPYVVRGVRRAQPPANRASRRRPMRAIPVESE